MLGGLAAAVAIIFFVTAHEAGHFFAAKATGMKVTQAFFGFGPRIWSVQRGETEYGFKWLPFGGYVRIIGMNPLEEVEPSDMGRTYREKKFWEKSFVVLSGVGLNFLMAFLIFYGLVLANGVPGDPTTEVAAVVADSPAEAAGLEVGDEIVAMNGVPIDEWDQLTDELAAAGPGPATITVDRDGEIITTETALVASETIEGAGFLGVGPSVELIEPGVIASVGYAGQLVWNSIEETFQAIFNMVRPSSIAQYLGVLVGNTEVSDEIRPVSPIGIVTIGTQVDSAAFFLGIMAHVNVILAVFNLLPLFPLDGGHFMVAVYEKITGREADVRRLMPIAAAVVGLFLFLGFVAIVLDVANPISL